MTVPILWILPLLWAVFFVIQWDASLGLGVAIGVYGGIWYAIGLATRR